LTVILDSHMMYGKSIHALGCPAFAATKLRKEE